MKLKLHWDIHLAILFNKMEFEKCLIMLGFCRSGHICSGVARPWVMDEDVAPLVPLIWSHYENALLWLTMLYSKTVEYDVIILVLMCLTYNCGCLQYSWLIYYTTSPFLQGQRFNLSGGLTTVPVLDLVTTGLLETPFLVLSLLTQFLFLGLYLTLTFFSSVWIFWSRM